MGKIQPGARIDPRMTEPVTVQDAELQPGQKYTLIALARIEKALQLIGRDLIGRSKRVDEYSTVGSYTTGASGAVTASVEVLPQFEMLSELIESVLVTGPASTAFILQLGDRQWTLQTNAQGIMPIGPVALMLSRNDRRLLTSAVAGDWTLELMGHADARY